MRRQLFITLILSSLLFCSCTSNKTNKNPSSSSDEEPHTDPTPSDVISLYDASSKYYMRNLMDKDTISSLKTYHHKDFDDVPYIDFNEYHYAVRPYIERSRKFYQGDNDHTYIYSRIEDTGKMIFDTEKNTLTINNVLAFHYDVIGTNNGVDGDITNNNIKLYKESEKTYEEAQQKVMSALSYSPYYAFCVAFNDIVKHENIKNVVIDLTGNIGGEVRCIPYLAAFMTNDPSMVYRNTLDNSLIDLHYKVDLNGDGTYGGEGDTFEGKYKFYLLDGANFSAGNEFAVMAKNCGYAKLLGEKSAGGSCAIANRVDSSGLTYKLSSPINLQLKQGDTYITNDAGVDVDYQLPFNNWFNLTELDSFLNTLQ